MLARLILAALLIALALSIALAAQGFAHPDDENLSQWYRSLRTPSGSSCCSLEDCGPIEARLTTDGWEIMVADGVWQPVPPEAILERENPTFMPVACRFLGRTLCFIPGSRS